MAETKTKKSEVVKSVVGHVVAADKEKVKAIDALMKVYINKKCPREAEAAVMLGASKEAKGSLVEALVKDQQVSSALRLVKLGVCQRTIDLLAKSALDGDWLADYYESLGQLPEVVEALIKICILRGKPAAIRRVVRLRKDGKLTTDEINSLVSVCCTRGGIERVIQAVRLGDRELTTEEIKLLTKAVEK